MKKSFFKKLSFVLALAMIVSTIAPAASAFAAATPKISTTATKYLTLGQTNEYNFNVANKATGAKYAFTSSDKKVATVDSKSGVTTAKAVGTTTIKLTATLKNGKKYTSSCKVIVKDNFKTLVIAGAPVDGKLVVNAENTFSTTGTTYGGASASKTAVVAFAVTDGDGKATTGATITDAGVFKATVPGTYKVTANAFQSSAKYADWKTTGKGATATVSTTVTVVNAIKSVAAVKTDAVKVTFEAAATAVDKANFTLVNKATSAKVIIKSVELSTDKTYATVTTYDTLVSGQTYTLTAKVDGTDMSGEIAFVKGTPKSISVATAQSAPANESYSVKYTILDENGLDITNGTPVFYEDTTGGNGTYTLAQGQMVYVTVCYINPTTGEVLKSEKVTITGVSKTASSLVSYTIVKDNANPNFTTPTTSVKLEAAGTYTVKIKAKDQYGNDIAPSAGQVSYESLDPSVFVIDSYTGNVTPIAVGTGSFRITYGGISVIKTLEVKAKAVRTSLVFNKTVVSVSDTGNGLNNATLNFNFKDQYGDKINAGTDTVSVKVISDTTTATSTITGPGVTTTSLNKNVAGNSALTLISDKDYTIAAVSGTNGGSVTLQASGNGFNVIITINAIKADTTVVGYMIDGVKALDVQQAYDGDANTNDYKTNLAIYSVNAGGYKVAAVTNGSIEIKTPDAKTVTASSLTPFTFDTTATTDLKFKTGTFTINAKSSTGYNIFPATIVVTDTGVKPVVTLKKNELKTTISTGDLETNYLDGLSGTNLHVTAFKYTTGNIQIVAANPDYTAGPVSISSYTVGTTVISSTLLYGFTVELTDSVTHRVWEYNFGTLTAKNS